MLHVHRDPQPAVFSKTTNSVIIIIYRGVTVMEGG